MRCVLSCMLVLVFPWVLHSQGVQARASVGATIVQPAEVMQDSVHTIKVLTDYTYQRLTFIDSIGTKQPDSSIIWRRYWATAIIFE
jgi:hypothetical protein